MILEAQPKQRLGRFIGTTVYFQIILMHYDKSKEIYYL